MILGRDDRRGIVAFLEPRNKGEEREGPLIGFESNSKLSQSYSIQET